MTDDATALPAKAAPAALAVLRVGVAVLWIQNAGWKRPPAFGQGDPPRALYKYTRFAVEHEVLAPYAWLVERVVLPNFSLFGWMTLLLEASLGAFLLVGLVTRLWALAGLAQSLLITLSVLNAPHEWHWAYYLMILAHLVLLGTAAGRHYGVDGLLRPLWQRSRGPVSRLLLGAS